MKSAPWLPVERRASGTYFRVERSELNQAFGGDIIFKKSDSTADGFIYFVKDVAECVKKWTYCRGKQMSSDLTNIT